MVESTGLENQRACKRSVGSNPTLSAIFTFKFLIYKAFSSQCRFQVPFQVPFRRVHMSIYGQFLQSNSVNQELNTRFSKNTALADRWVNMCKLGVIV